MKNAKIITKNATPAISALVAKVICAQKFAGVDLTKKVSLSKRPRVMKAEAAPADIGSAVMAGVVDSGKKAATKVENYSAEVTEKLLADWEASDKSKDAVVKLADTFGKTARSIVAKLSREKVYVKQAYTTKAGTVPVSKEEHVATIAAFCGVSVDKLESLEKANKGVLVILETVLTKLAHMEDNKAE